jgi:hypothetical protein
LHNQWIDKRFHQDDRLNFSPYTDEEESIAIVAPKTTDVLRVQPTSIPPGLRLDPVASAGLKAAYYSAAFIVKALAASALDIDPDEFDISNVRQIELPSGEKAGELIISDHLPNGAGFTAWVRNNWHDLLATATDTNAAPDTFMGTMTSTSHRSCDSSCYTCLRNYRNMAYHGLLDWRLGLSLLSGLQSDGFLCGLDGDLSTPDLDGWIEYATSLRDSFCTSFNAQAHDFDQLPGLVIGEKRVLVIHPLWDPSHPGGLLAAAIADCGQTNPLTLDTFNLLRRPAWSYQAIGQ